MTLVEAVQEATGERVEAAFVDQGVTGEVPAAEAAERRVRLEAVRLPEAKRVTVGCRGDESLSAPLPGWRAAASPRCPTLHRPVPVVAHSP